MLILSILSLGNTEFQPNSHARGQRIPEEAVFMRIAALAVKAAVCFILDGKNKELGKSGIRNTDFSCFEVSDRLLQQRQSPFNDFPIPQFLSNCEKANAVGLSYSVDYRHNFSFDTYLDPHEQARGDLNGEI